MRTAGGSSSLPAMSTPFFTRYGFRRTGDRASPLEIEPYDAICVAGCLRATVVASAIDLVGGLETRAHAGLDATFTSDLSLRIPVPGRPARLIARVESLRAGRRLVTTGVRLVDATNGQLFAEGVTTFTRIPRPPDAIVDAAALATPEHIPSHPLEAPLHEVAGIESEAGQSGRVSLPLQEAHRNPEGILQGALVALLVEEAALAAARGGGRNRDPEQVAVSEMDLRFLSAASQGPVRASAEWVGSVGSGMLRVELRDRGQADRLTALAFVRVTRQPPLGHGTPLS
jgi:acyl-coenzyme A thioesterase PaaI-like protein